MSEGASTRVAVQRIRLELLLQKTGPVRILSPIPFATPLAVVFYLKWASVLALVWLGLFYAVVAVTYLRRRTLQARGPLPDHELPDILRGRVRDILLLGAMWGLAPWMLSAHRSTDDIVLISIFIMGAISLGSAIVSTHRQTIAAFSLPAGAGMVSACFWHGGLVGWVLAVCMALFLVMTLKWTFQQADLLEQSLTVRFEKEDLARRLEQQVELVENANREKSRFLASASHDLRQPLHAISLFTSVLERSRLDPDSAQTVTRLSHSVRLLNQSLDTMLDISRLDAGAVQPSVEAVGVHGLFLSLSHTFAGSAQERELQIRFRAPGELAVMSDAQLLTRLLGNLIDNAIKYTRSGGVLIAARTGAPAARAGWVCFEVIDTGIGIAREHQVRVFDEFFQLDNPQRDRAAGLGIGLSIVKRLSSLLEHPIELSSTPARGTRFRVWVRQAVEGTPALAGPAPADPVVSEGRLPRHVLIVDDERVGREALSLLLSSCGCTVHGASDLPQARQLLEANPIEAVVSDDRLPGDSNGLAFLLALRDSAPHLRTLLVTGETAPQRISEIKASGVPFLHKPVVAQQLLNALSGRPSA
ncbi:ATP-binding response regulator [Hydrogenophaga intermedia]|uniref:histidine kinase n=1 Tax=Hydrogenophaga intermedia TaxID=65786 RepID=A0A1L1PJF6_HYDIT|nr:hybrid sensor histidine kinase/response regulator [Hydrogenophaga intermedia]TMU70767.1 response regulator [Hydrogenophaga intermedia]CDN90132.1 Sensor protein [Hydrogenophaga intermedia]